MRADRLISLIMLLETKGALTAKELAEELEVSQRTIYRDIDALCTAGIPVYGEAGPEGGYRLAEGYKSNLNKLNKEEAMLLLSLNMTEQLKELEIGSKLDSALLKIRSSCKTPSDNEEITSRLYIDSTSWNKKGKHVSYLNTIYNAISSNKKLSITYYSYNSPGNEFSKIVDPYGLVAKERVWYLVYSVQEKVRVINIANIISVDEAAEFFIYPREFRLKNFWHQWCQEIGEQYSSFNVRVRVPKVLSPSIDMYIKEGNVPFSPIPNKYSGQEWSEIELTFHSFEDARNKLLVFGSAVKVIEPISLVYSIKDYAEQVLNLYK